MLYGFLNEQNEESNERRYERWWKNAEENQTRKILEILSKCKDLEEAIAKVKALLGK